MVSDQCGHGNATAAGGEAVGGSGDVEEAGVGARRGKGKGTAVAEWLRPGTKKAALAWDGFLWWR